jgi:tRNA pseudouridine55 synthase
VDRTAREVEIRELDLQQFRPGAVPSAQLRVVCSSGTYIRTLAADIGAALGVGGAMASLQRVRAGQFRLSQAHSLEDLERASQEGRLAEQVLDVGSALSDWPQYTVTAPDALRFRHGNPISVADPEASGDHLAAVRGPDGMVVGIGRIDSGTVAPVKVLLPAE